jgi:multidrug efflux pump subunit AcrB
VTVPGAVVPFLHGGKQRQVMIDLNEGLVQSKGLAPQDILTAVQQQNLILPSGTAKRISEKKPSFHHFLRLCTFARVPAGAFLFNLI